MAAVSTADLMLYCRVDAEEAAPLLENLANSAEEYLTTAGAVRTESNANAYDLAVKALVLQWYDNPGGGEVSPALRQSINQLKFSSLMEYAT